MKEGRRTFLAVLLPAILAARALAAEAPQGGAQKTPKSGLPPFPSQPGEDSPNPDPKAILKQNQKDIQTDVERLFKLAQELKGEVEKTDSSQILSLPLIKKAEEVERLAKKIKELARYI